MPSPLNNSIISSPAYNSIARGTGSFPQSGNISSNPALENTGIVDNATEINAKPIDSSVLPSDSGNTGSQRGSNLDILA